MKIPKTIGPTITTGTSYIEVGGSGSTLEVPMTGTLEGVFIVASRAGVETAAEADLIQVQLSSSHAPLKEIAPCELLAEPMSGGLGADISNFREKAAYYALNCPVRQGNKLKVEAKELVSCTVHVYVMVTFIFSDQPSKERLYHYRVGTLTAEITAGSTGDKKGSQITLGEGSRLTGVYGIIVDTTLATGKGHIGKFRLSSSNLKGAGDIEWHGEFVGGILGGAAAQGCTRISKLEGLDIPFTVPCTMDDYWNLTVAVTTAGNFVIGVQYI
jgi:hypothetical protein